MDASVIVATRNRSLFLGALLDAFARQTLPTGTSWELLVVDNGSTDDTADVLAQELDRGRLPLLALREPVPGKSRALNLAMARARGDLWVFTVRWPRDPQVAGRPAWLAAYRGALCHAPRDHQHAGLRAR